MLHPEQKENRLIPLPKWNDYYDYPTVSGMRMKVFNADNNGFNDCLIYLYYRPYELALTDKRYTYLSIQNVSNINAISGIIWKLESLISLLTYDFAKPKRNLMLKITT